MMMIVRMFCWLVAALMAPMAVVAASSSYSAKGASPGTAATLVSKTGLSWDIVQPPKLQGAVPLQNYRRRRRRSLQQNEYAAACADVSGIWFASDTIR